MKWRGNKFSFCNMTRFVKFSLKKIVHLLKMVTKSSVYIQRGKIDNTSFSFWHRFFLIPYVRKNMATNRHETIKISVNDLSALSTIYRYTIDTIWYYWHVCGRYVSGVKNSTKLFQNLLQMFFRINISLCKIKNSFVEHVYKKILFKFIIFGNFLWKIFS